MRAYVFTDPALAKLAGRFVWLSLDTEQPSSAGFLDKFPIQQWPSLFVIDPETETATLKWLGTATVSELEKLLDEGERAVRGSHGTAADEALAKADRLYGQGRSAEAALAYVESMKTAPSDWPRRTRAIESAVTAFDSAHAKEACARLAQEQGPALPPGRSFANVVGIGLDCAVTAPSDAPWRTRAIEMLEPLAQRALTFDGLLADDRSGLYETLVDARKDRGDIAGARTLAREWLSMLEAEAAKAPTPQARAVFDPHRVAASIAAGEPERALGALLQSEKELPGDYDAPERLTSIYAELGRYDDALAAADRALAKVTGPRKIVVYENKARVYQKKGDTPSARRTLEEALKFAETLPPSQNGPRLAALLKRSLARLP